jgi:hypothetical protein
MALKFTKKGLTFGYSQDEVTYVWPWARSSTAKRFSSVLVHDFNGFRDYWFQRGQDTSGALVNRPVVGFERHELLGEFTRRLLPGEYVLALTDIQPEAKPAEFWARMPAQTRKAFIDKDYCFLICKDRDRALDMAYSVGRNFAESYLFRDGVLIDTNLWKSDVGQGF